VKPAVDIEAITGAKGEIVQYDRSHRPGDVLRSAPAADRPKSLGDQPIVFLLDAGFFDDNVFQTIEDLGVYYIATGKMYEHAQKAIEAANNEPDLESGYYVKGKKAWKSQEFTYRCHEWKRSRRAFYTVPVREMSGQMLLELSPAESIIITNVEESCTTREGYSRAENIIGRFHSRGGHELVHRSLKEFGSEKLPFMRFMANAAYYNLMVISHFAFNCFVEDNLESESNERFLQAGSYANTVRRRFLDFAAKMVKTSRRLVLKATRVVYECLNLADVWRKCNNPALVL